MNERHERNSNTPTREDILIGRITDGEASPNDWAEIESIAESDPGVWHRLASSQRTHARMESAVEDAIAIAELIDAPDMRRVGRPVIARIREYSGWALAAGLALALGVTLLNPGATRGDACPSAARGVGGDPVPGWTARVRRAPEHGGLVGAGDLLASGNARARPIRARCTTGTC